MVNLIRGTAMLMGLSSIADIARELGVSYQHLHDTLRGRRFSVKLAQKLAKLLELPEAELVEWQRSGRERLKQAIRETQPKPEEAHS